MSHFEQRTIVVSGLILQVIRSHGAYPSTDRFSAIDYFGRGQTNGAQIRSNLQEYNTENDGEEDCDMEHEDSTARGKRKQKHVARDVKIKKKKSKRDQVDVEGKDAYFCFGSDSGKMFDTVYNPLCGSLQVVQKTTMQTWTHGRPYWIEKSTAWQLMKKRSTR